MVLPKQDVDESNLAAEPMDIDVSADEDEEMQSEYTLPAYQITDDEPKTVYSTFQQACKAYGWLIDDKEWNHSILEADQNGATAMHLRDMYCFILINNAPPNAAELWNRHKDLLSNDYLHHPQKKYRTSQEAYNRTLLDIQHCLITNGLSMGDFGLPVPDPTEDIGQLAAELQAELDYNPEECEKRWQAARAKMDINECQRRLFDSIVALLDNNSRERQNVHFVDAPGGTGKTFVFNALLDYVRSMKPRNGQKHIALALAASGIAALLLNGGRTVHSRFGLGINVNAKSTCRYSTNSKCVLTELIRRTDLILWDECTMSSKHIVNAVDTALQDIMQCDLPFGGKLVVFGGDFRQTLCVVDKAWPPREATVKECIQNSNVWRFAKHHKLVLNMRIWSQSHTVNTEKLKQWESLLLAIGEGKNYVTEEAVIKHFKCRDLIRIDKELQSPCKNLKELVAAIYSSWKDVDESLRSATAILTPTNKSVTQINDDALEHVPGNIIERQGEDRVVDDGQYIPGYVDDQFLARETPAGFPRAILKLKLNVPVMLLRNLTPTKGCCNGTRFLIEHVGMYTIRGRILNGPHKFRGKVYFIPRIKLQTQPGLYPWGMFTRKQFPIRLAFGMTINKAQGQTFKNVALYLPQAVFSHGQMYVALSRVGNPDNVQILIMQTTQQGELNGDMYTRNVVYKEVLTE